MVPPAIVPCSPAKEAPLELGGLEPERLRATPGGPRDEGMRQGLRETHSPAAPPPLVSVVIPLRPGAPRPRALGAFRRLGYPAGRLEILLARGISPARQRNVAVARSRGKYLVFLDDDSEVSPALLWKYLEVLEADPRAAAAGGPAPHRPGGSRLEQAFSLVLSEPLVVGRSASRYRPRGRLRESDERELILCNLCVRRRAFDTAGGFDERLYPNEENELLEALRLRGWKLLYHPEAVVERPQRRSLREFLAAVFSYGRGRGAQALCLPSGASLGRLLLAALGALAVLSSLLGLLARSSGLLAPAGLYGVYLLVLALRLGPRAGPLGGVAGAAVSLLVHAVYAAGVLWGLLAPGFHEASEVSVERVPGGREARCPPAASARPAGAAMAGRPSAG